MAALTRSGARKASEIVMLTLRTLHPSRLAMLSAFAFASARSSSSQRRPRAIDATSSARVSERIGRACCGGSPAGRRSHGAALMVSCAMGHAGCCRRCPLTIGRLCSGKLDDQLLRLDLDARDVGVDEAAVVNRR